MWDYLNRILARSTFKVVHLEGPIFLWNFASGTFNVDFQGCKRYWIIAADITQEYII